MSATCFWAVLGSVRRWIAARDPSMATAIASAPWASPSSTCFTAARMASFGPTSAPSAPVSTDESRASASLRYVERTSATLTPALPISMPNHVGISPPSLLRSLDVVVEHLTADVRLQRRADAFGRIRPDRHRLPAGGAGSRSGTGRRAAERRRRRPEVDHGVDLHARLALVALDHAHRVDREDLALGGDALREVALRQELDRLEAEGRKERAKHSQPLHRAHCTVRDTEERCAPGGAPAH